jgi:Glycoside hydrolase family 2 C-terminal domain 5
MKKLLSLICCCAVVTLCRSQQPVAPSPGRTINMDANWKFTLTDTVGADKAGFSDSQWRTLDLPHDWSIEGSFDSAARTGGGGRIVCEEEIRTTGASAAIRLTADRNNIQADGRDVVQVKIEVLDKDGYPVPDAGNNIVFSVDGAGHLIGLDNGDPMDHTPMKSNRRNVFHGLALGVIQSSARPSGRSSAQPSGRSSAASGVIRVQASSPGIAGDTIEIRTQMD